MLTCEWCNTHNDLKVYSRNSSPQSIMVLCPACCWCYENENKSNLKIHPKIHKERERMFQQVKWFIPTMVE